MSNYNPMLESQKFSAEVLQRGQSEAQQIDQRATEHLADTVRSVTQSNANRKESARQFDQSSQQRQQEFQQERGDRQQAREQAQGNWEKEYVQRQSQLAEAVRQHAESFSLEKKRFDLAVSEAALHEEVQKKIIEQKTLELQAFDIEHQRALRQAELEDAKTALSERRLRLRMAEQQAAAEQAASMTENDRAQWAESAGARLFGDLAPGEMGPQTASQGRDRALAAADSVSRERLGTRILDIAKASASSGMPNDEMLTLGIGVMSGEVSAKEAYRRMAAMEARQVVKDLGGAPMDRAKLEQALEKLPERAREIHGKIDPTLPIGNEGRLRLSSWIENNMTGVMQAFSMSQNPDRPIDPKSKEAQDRAVNDMLQALRPGDPRRNLMLQRLLELGALTQKDVEESVSMHGQDDYGYRSNTLRL